MNEVPRGWGGCLFAIRELRITQYKYKLYGIGWVPFISPLYQISMVDFVILLRSGSVLQFYNVAGAGCAYAAGAGDPTAPGGGISLVPALYALCSLIVHVSGSLRSICPVAMSDSG